jgi:hypothetical protein
MRSNPIVPLAIVLGILGWLPGGEDAEAMMQVLKLYDQCMQMRGLPSDGPENSDCKNWAMLQAGGVNAPLPPMTDEQAKKWVPSQ